MILYHSILLATGKLSSQWEGGGGGGGGGKQSEWNDSSGRGFYGEGATGFFCAAVTAALCWFTATIFLWPWRSGTQSAYLLGTDLRYKTAVCAAMTASLAVAIHSRTTGESSSSLCVFAGFRHECDFLSGQLALSPSPLQCRQQGRSLQRRLCAVGLAVVCSRPGWCLASLMSCRTLSSIV